MHDGSRRLVERRDRFRSARLARWWCERSLVFKKKSKPLASSRADS